MNATTVERPEVRAYLDAVRAQLADLPADERDDLVADLEASVIETGEAPTLSPQDFASELREAAGLAPEAAPVAHTSLWESVRLWLSSERAVAWGRTARELAPIWWLLRAYAAVAAVSLAVGFGWPIGTGVHRDGSNALGTLVVLFVATALSIWLGLRHRRKPGGRRALLAVDALLALALIPVAVHSIDVVRPQVIFEPVEQTVPGLAVDGVPIRNVYPYDRDGRLLLDVLLYDEFSRPIQVLSGEEDTSRRVLFAPDGTPIYNSFPIRYFEPGTNEVARPRLAPPVQVPEIETPELPSK